MTEINELLPENVHYWLPIADGRRHAFTGSRRYTGQSAGTTVCGAEVAMAAPSEMDWIHKPTCGYCWEKLISEHRASEGEDTRQTT